MLRAADHAFVAARITSLQNLFYAPMQENLNGRENDAKAPSKHTNGAVTPSVSRKTEDKFAAISVAHLCNLAVSLTSDS